MLFMMPQFYLGPFYGWLVFINPYSLFLSFCRPASAETFVLFAFFNLLKASAHNLNQ